MGSGSVVTAERKAAQGRAPVYVYNIAYRSNRKMDGTDIELGAMHASDIPLVFNTVASPTPWPATAPTASRRRATSAPCGPTSRGRAAERAGSTGLAGL
jgi:carboxylesterase type B